MRIRVVLHPCQQVVLSVLDFSLTLLAALFITAHMWKHLRCPSIGTEIQKMGCVQAMECYLAIKRNELSSYEETW